MKFCYWEQNKQTDKQTNRQTDRQRDKQIDADGEDGDAGGDADAGVPGLPLHEAPPPQDPTHLHRGRT